eukprot:TRINITY_DN25227_c0_g1_i1.p1 TRINITY_DN25227_c0_g1~~TRINITY_DN25227_c0_g1_i1.p1  ORF type:complete len:268 (+),score=63.88 TRINITY_DN25227_c0_g1_i1:35-838(+)
MKQAVTIQQAGSAAVFATILAGYAVRRGSLNKQGGLAAWGVGWCAWAAGGWHTAALLSFFFGSTFMTKVGKRVKNEREEGYGASKGRNHLQVLANGGVGTAAAVAWLLTHDPMFLHAHLVSYAAAAGDTWSSELGILSTAQPRLILGFREVPHGTNGGITPWGTFASLLGGLSVGIVSAAFTPPDTTLRKVLLLSALGGLVGSVIDSVLGQLFEYSGWRPDTKMVTYNPAIPGAKHVSGIGLLGNDTVNFLANILTTISLTLLTPQL